MKRNWSATRQAEENLALKAIAKHNEELISRIQIDINTIYDVLAQLNTVTADDADVINAIRSLGAYQAILERKLFKERQS